MDDPGRTLTSKQIAEVAEDLRGSTKSLDEVLASVLNEEYVDFCDFSQSTLCAIDELVFQCALCGWWCGTDELSEDETQQDLVCVECVPAKED